MDFVGSKLLLLNGDLLLACLRDDKPDLPYAAHWDLPGGGREGDETPEACVLRELEEEFGLTLAPDRLLRRWKYPSMMVASRASWFFAGVISAAEVAAIRFGDLGQYWQMMRVADFLAHPLGVPDLQHRARAAVADSSWS